MPSHLPSSFASAAAGQSSRDTRPSGRNEPRGGGDWYVLRDLAPHASDLDGCGRLLLAFGAQ